MSFFTLSEVPEREVIPGYRARFVHGENMTEAHWRIEAGAEMPLHSHPHEQITFLIQGEFEFNLDGEKKVIGPGWGVIIPPNVPHSGIALEECVILDAFYPVREDYR